MLTNLLTSNFVKTGTISAFLSNMFVIVLKLENKLIWHMKANTNNQTIYVFVDCCMLEMGAFDKIFFAS